MGSGKVGKIMVKVDVSNITSEKFISVKALIDTGSDETVIPLKLANQLGIKLNGGIWIRTGNWPAKVGTGGAKIILNGRLAYANIWISDRVDKVLIGVIVLEQLGLKVNPRKGVLEAEEQVLYAGIR